MRLKVALFPTLETVFFGFSGGRGISNQGVTNAASDAATTTSAGRRFTKALADQIQVTLEALTAALDVSRAEAAARKAKVDGAPAPTLRTYEEMVEQSDWISASALS